ncbi:YraN family protein [Pseudooceanicola nanhaiensis]|uniref:YraN family protein n=1 Tax=Pseudooceanicola nanhaiensis TaxID=375761 RepID=UPI004058223E
MRHWPDEHICGAPVTARRRSRGRMAHLGGAAAEDRVALEYERRGYALAARRWRGRSGEIDLVFRHGDAVIFVEVKAARDFDAALCSLGQRQIGRICRAAEEFVGGEPGGSLTEMRFDIGLVDARGDLRILENALAA